MILLETTPPLYPPLLCRGGSPHHVHPPVLLYHKVTPNWDVGVVWVTPGQFESHIKGIYDSGWTTTHPCQVNPEFKVFTIVFDDAYECIYKYALPVMRQYGFTGTIFIPTGYIGKQNDWDHQLLGRKFRHVDSSMLSGFAEAGWTIGSHTVSHVNLDGCSASKLKNELADSRRKLEDLTGVQVTWISYPFGRYNQRIIDESIQCGYTGAIVPVSRKVDTYGRFQLIQADAVYLWDTADMVRNRLKQQGITFKTGRLLRRGANALSTGTILWKRLFRKKMVKTA